MIEWNKGSLSYKQYGFVNFKIIFISKSKSPFRQIIILDFFTSDA